MFDLISRTKKPKKPENAVRKFSSISFLVGAVIDNLWEDPVVDVDRMQVSRSRQRLNLVVTGVSEIVSQHHCNYPFRIGNW